MVDFVFVQSTGPCKGSRTAGTFFTFSRRFIVFNWDLMQGSFAFCILEKCGI